MAADAHPPIFGTAVDGWRYTFAALSRMPVVLGVGLLAVIAINTLTIPISLDPKEETTAVGQLIELAVSIANGFVLTPVAIAVHRFILLGEITDRYALNPSEHRFMQFFIWTVLYQLLITAPSVLVTLSAGGTGSLLSTAVVLLIFGIIASLRLLILFPAIAVDARRARWDFAFADTK